MNPIKTSRKSFRPILIRGWVLFVLSVLAYANTMHNDYAVDDVYAITRNQFTRQGFEGIDDLLSKNFFAGFLGEQEIALSGGRYRPLSLITFAIEFEILGENPGASHAINMLLYALLVVLLFKVYRKVFVRSEETGWLFDLLFVSLLIFSVHPVHTEVVSNIKGRDEILAFIFSILSLQAALSLHKSNNTGKVIWMMVAFFLALMSKENAAAFILIIPLSLYWKGLRKPRLIIQTFVFLLIPLFAFVAIRMAVLGTLNPGISTELMDNPFLEAGLSERLGTVFVTFGEYYRLMLFPHPLTWDYYPYHIPLTSIVSFRSIWPLVLTAGMLFLAFWGSKKRRVFSYGLWFYFLSFFMVSNLLFTTGVFMAERFLFMPSFGLSLCLGSAFVFLGRLSGGKYLLVVKLILITILMSFFVKTISRNRVWKDNFTLYTTDVKVSKNSAKGNNIAAQFYAYEANLVTDPTQKDAYREKAMYHYGRAVSIHPAYSDAWFHYGNAWYDVRGNLDSLLFCYQKVLERIPQDPNVWKNLGLIVKARQGVDDRIAIRRLMLKMHPEHPESLSELGRLLASRNEWEEALPMIRNAVKRLPGDALAWETLGYIYYSKNQLDSALVAYQNALHLDPANQRFKQNVHAILTNMGRSSEAAIFAP